MEATEQKQSGRWKVKTGQRKKNLDVDIDIDIARALMSAYPSRIPYGMKKLQT
jgi:hypothetical protein